VPIATKETQISGESRLIRWNCRDIGKLVRKRYAKPLSGTLGWNCMRRNTILVTLYAIAVATGCKSVERFDTGQDSVYCLELISGTSESGMVPDGGVPTDSAVNPLRLALTIDAQHLSTRPGVLWSNDADFGLCSPQPLFDKAPIRTIQPALSDVVSSVQLTSDHVQDVFAWVDSTCQNTMVSILSLIDGGSVEVRLFKPKSAMDDNGPAQQRSGFGVFARSQRLPTCGF